VELGAVAAPAEAAERLRLDPGDQALIRRRRMYADDEPMQLATSYVPWSLAEGTPMTTEDTGPGGLYSRLADVGHRPVRFTEEVAIRMSSEDESRFLNLPAPVFTSCGPPSMTPTIPWKSASRSCQATAGN
jgi:GntR family transcriptional regulator